MISLALAAVGIVAVGGVGHADGFASLPRGSCLVAGVDVTREGECCGAGWGFGRWLGCLVHAAMLERVAAWVK